MRNKTQHKCHFCPAVNGMRYERSPGRDATKINNTTRRQVRKREKRPHTLHKPSIVFGTFFTLFILIRRCDVCTFFDLNSAHTQRGERKCYLLLFGCNAVIFMALCILWRCMAKAYKSVEEGEKTSFSHFSRSALRRNESGAHTSTSTSIHTNHIF